jgi:hypothetical protein
MHRMIIRRALMLASLLATAASFADFTPLAAQAPQDPGGALPAVPRGIRRDVPLTASIRRAFEAGTRDTTGRPGPNYWQLETDYETIALHNNSPQELRDIFMRLDHNIYRGLVPRGSSVPAENTDGMVVTRITVDGETVDLTPPAPQSGRGFTPGPRKLSASGLDQTLARIALVTPIPAKTNATLQIDWHTKLPGGPNSRGHRMVQRWDDELFQPTQWYPRIAKFDDLRGWDTNVYLGPAEFYNNFGRFDVKIDVPAGWIVSGTGTLQNPEEVLTPKTRERLSHACDSDEVVTIVGDEEVGPGQATTPGDRLVWHYVAEKVNDFAWATAKKYDWRATRATIPGRGAIPIYMFFQPEHANQYANAGPIARHALEFYSKLWAPYPFPQLTLQDGPSSGMEYPMVINANQGAADHETGHQWWPMMVGTDETWYGWMDEGFNQYMNILSAADRRGAPPNLNGLGQSYGRMAGSEEEPPMMWNANYAGNFYGFQTYQKAPLMLSMLGGIVGDEAVQRAMSDYAKTWSFKHPSPWDYIFFMDRALGRDLRWFWYYWLWTTESVDGSIANVATSSGRTIVTVRQSGEMPSPVVLKVEFAPSGPPIKPMPNAKVDGTTATVTWPVDVWFNGSRTFDATLEFGPRPITRITLDPACRFPDRDATDNVWPRDSKGAVSSTAPSAFAACSG